MAEAMKATVASMLKGIDRYNPENLTTLEKYIDIQARENAYDLEANLAVLKLYQFNPTQYRLPVVQMILLKALTNLPHTDFVLCKCLIDQQNLEHDDIKSIVYLHDLLETCHFEAFWDGIKKVTPLINGIAGFEDSIRKFICHVVNITFQSIEKDTLSTFLGGLPDYQLQVWMNKYGWKETEQNLVFISNQEENIKTKNITEKIEFDSVAAIMSLTR
ncbi:eukaryotic translation initiation factor 3 subunit K-like [Argiope bruennichi]|uniref:Eukaryotic translation initiation factor 3 subunit K n=1 Tax=Argiope bruennichi TaxID=94029 RepID=A0A8T0FBK1_ARGBR|nr:eukaryotic translation initiation factor 3 subunit K-like [Argiope bruennichi]KAF8788281.1 Eukaryotic translation initiation factor 3 like protein [Argiope bruennichi]